MFLAAVPAVIVLQEQDVIAATTRADNAIGPATGHKVFAAVYRIGEVEDRFLQAFRFHAQILEQKRYFVKYIITQI
jgi:hypothetical protein